VTDTDTDPFSQLLAEALRAGPGSEPWKEAVARIGVNPAASNEHQLLLEARELLASGKSFREIRAGAGFTRKLMDGLDQEKDGGKKKSIPTPVIITTIALIAIVIALAWLGYHLYPRGTPDKGSSGGDLATMYFPTELATATFAGPMPAAWRTMGALPLDPTDGLKPSTGSDTGGAAIILKNPVSPDDSFAFEAELHLTHPQDGVVTQVFISTTGDFSDDRATSSHELLWSLRGTNEQVVLDGKVVPVSESAVHGDSVRVRIVMNHDQAIVEADGHALWSGPHELSATPRYLGVRFIRSTGTGDAGISVRSLKVLEK
jgi:hypothetical protein